MAIRWIHFFVSGVILVDPSGIVSGEVRLIKLATPITAYIKYVVKHKSAKLLCRLVRYIRVSMLELEC